MNHWASGGLGARRGPREGIVPPQLQSSRSRGGGCAGLGLEVCLGWVATGHPQEKQAGFLARPGALHIPPGSHSTGGAPRCSPAAAARPPCVSSRAH